MGGGGRELLLEVSVPPGGSIQLNVGIAIAPVFRSAPSRRSGDCTSRQVPLKPNPPLLHPPAPKDPELAGCKFFSVGGV